MGVRVIKQFTNSKFANETEAMNRKPTKLLVANTTNTVIGLSSNLPRVNTGNRPSHYRKRSNRSLTPADWSRYSKKFLESLRCNFPEKDSHCWFITLTFADQRYKNVKTAIKKAKEFCESFNLFKDKAVSSIVVELDYKHHPHVHLLLRTPIVTTKEHIKKAWKYGYLTATNKPSNWEKITNYLIKTYSDSDNMDFDYKKAKEFKNDLRILKKLMKSKTVSKQFKRNVQKLIRKYKSLLKKENQKQLCLSDKPTYFSYGQRHYDVIKNDNDSTIVDLMSNSIKYVSTSENKVRNTSDYNPLFITAK